jgi:alginate O-acetyltransferase complex protein AlgI
MVFSSLHFLTVFLPLFLISYYLIDVKYKNLCVLLYSLGFYFYGCLDNPHYVLILIASLLINYLFGLWIDRASSFRKALLVIAILFNVSILFVFKYFDFFIDIINYLINANSFLSVFSNSFKIHKLNLVLPIGISFYTFQIMSYIFDVYYKKIEVEKNFINLSTYIIMFPQLIAGPIIRYSDVKKDIEKSRNVNVINFLSGLRVFIFGLGSKVIIANQLSAVQIDVNVFNVSELSASTIWLQSIAYGLQLYFDFFGYSLMAIGLGKMMGISIMKNFDEPFKAITAGEFWRRWHISLGSWFKDYMLYPILMSKRMASIRTFLSKHISKSFGNFMVNFIAMFIVWFTTGLWHGAHVNYVLWGLYFFVFMVLEQLFIGKLVKKQRLLGHIYLIIVVIVSFTIFSNENLSNLIFKIQKMWQLNSSFFDEHCYNIFITNLKAIVIGVLFATTIPQRIYKRISSIKYIDVVVIACILALSVFLIYKGYNDPFMYFRF